MRRIFSLTANLFACALRCQPACEFVFVARAVNLSRWMLRAAGGLIHRNDCANRANESAAADASIRGCRFMRAAMLRSCLGRITVRFY